MGKRSNQRYNHYSFTLLQQQSRFHVLSIILNIKLIINSLTKYIVFIHFLSIISMKEKITACSINHCRSSGHAHFNTITSVFEIKFHVMEHIINENDSCLNIYLLRKRLPKSIMINYPRYSCQLDNICITT